MNIYYAVTNYHLLCCILHSIKYHKNEKNILYLSIWHPDHVSLINNLKKLNFFYRVEAFEEVVFPSGNKKINNEQLKKDIDFIVKHIPRKFINDVKKSDNIYIAGDHYCSSVYLVKNKILYNYIEEACGVLSDEKRLMNNIENIDYSRFQIMKKLKLPGNHSYILNRYGDFNHQLPGYKNKKDIHFSVNEILKTLSYEAIYKIVGVFSDEKFELPDNTTLLLTFHYVNMQFLTMADQQLLYYYLVDYFGGVDSKRIVIKQHPSDVQPNYHEWFPNSLILPRKLPSELLPFLSKSKYNKVMTAYSTSIFSFKNYCNNIISFNSRIDEDFKSIHKYYFLLQMISNLKLKGYNIYCVGLNESIVNNILLEYGIKNLNVFFIDNMDEIVDNKNKIIVFEKDLLNFDKSSIYENDLVFFLESLELSKKLDESNKLSLILHKQLIENNDNNSVYLDDEIIILYCLNNTIISQVRKLKIFKLLNCSNLKIELVKDFSLTYYQQREHISMLDNNIKKMGNELFFEKNKNLEIYESLVKLQNDYNITKEEDNNTINEYRDSLDFYKKKYEDVINSSSWKLTTLYRKIGCIVKKIFGR